MSVERVLSSNKCKKKVYLHLSAHFLTTLLFHGTDSTPLQRLSSHVQARHLTAVKSLCLNHLCRELQATIDKDRGVAKHCTHY